MPPTAMYLTPHSEVCPACRGDRIQINKEGIRILCPVCGGKGYFYNHEYPIYSSTSVSNSPLLNYQVYQ